MMGKYIHEVLAEATPDDLAYFIAAKRIRERERKRAESREALHQRIHGSGHGRGRR